MGKKTITGSKELIDRYVHEAVRAVLKELGSPCESSQKYNKSKRYLIGPENINTYVFGEEILNVFNIS